MKAQLNPFATMSTAVTALPLASGTALPAQSGQQSELGSTAAVLPSSQPVPTYSPQRLSLARRIIGKLRELGERANDGVNKFLIKHGLDGFVLNAQATLGTRPAVMSALAVDGAAILASMGATGATPVMGMAPTSRVGNVREALPLLGQDEIKKKVCLMLAECDSEDQVIMVLQNLGLWDEPEYWRDLGDIKNNDGLVSAQQADADRALNELFANSVDAVKTAKCLSAGIDPNSEKAPQSVRESGSTLFGFADGSLAKEPKNERDALAERIAIVATGGDSRKVPGSKRSKRLPPCISIIDQGEGQTADSMPTTLMSLLGDNKQCIHFTHGVYNMGSSGVLPFCGNHGLKLIITKRNPDIIGEEGDDRWAFTIVRRVDPRPGDREKTPSYKYLAPDSRVISFKSDALPLLPGKYPNAVGDGGRPLPYGTFIKMYEYQLPHSLRGNVTGRLQKRLNILMPEPGLPARLYERRKGIMGDKETTVEGLIVKLEEDGDRVLEPGFPESTDIGVLEEEFIITMYLFKRGTAKDYMNGESMIFSVDGQNYSSLPRVSLFSRKALNRKLGYVKDDLLIHVDCSRLSPKARKIFMGSKDRMRDNAMYQAIMSEIEQLVLKHKGIRYYHNLRQDEAIRSRTEGNRLQIDFTQEILKRMPEYARVFAQQSQGRLQDPFDTRDVRSRPEDSWQGNEFPTFFKLKKGFTRKKPKIAHLGERFRLSYSTDVRNDYFSRPTNRGSFVLRLNSDVWKNRVINLRNGVATLNVTLPEGAQPGSVLRFDSEVSDISHQHNPFKEHFYVKVAEERATNGGSGGRKDPPDPDELGDDTNTAAKRELPNMQWVEPEDDDYHTYGFNRDSVLKIVPSGSGFDFYLNGGNIHLLTELKTNDEDPRVIREKYKIFMVGNALMRIKFMECKYQGNSTDEVDIPERVADQMIPSAAMVFHNFRLGRIDLEDDID